MSSVVRRMHAARTARSDLRVLTDGLLELHETLAALGDGLTAAQHSTILQTHRKERIVARAGSLYSFGRGSPPSTLDRGGSYPIATNPSCGDDFSQQWCTPSSTDPPDVLENGEPITARRLALIV